MPGLGRRARGMTDPEEHAVGKERLEAFSDGVLAIIITIMVLELKAPHGVELDALKPLVPVFLSYVLSFVYVGIYWNNHHHLLHATKHVSGGILWANLHLLFWLSLIPFGTAWMSIWGVMNAAMSVSSTRTSTSVSGRCTRPDCTRAIFCASV